MTRLWLAVLLLGGTVAFLSCSSSELGAPDGGAGGTAGGSGGRGGDGGQCPGLEYFVDTGRCASTFAAQAAKDFNGSCSSRVIKIGGCGEYQIWSSSTRPGSQGDPVTCVYDASGDLIGAQVCTDYSAWPCAGGLGLCLTVGPVANVGPCSLADACQADGGGGG